MLFISFKGIKTSAGEYVIEVSRNADGEPRWMKVSDAFFMSIPAELLTRTLDTARNQQLHEQQERNPDTTFVRTLRGRFGTQRVTGEVVTYDTHLSIMEDRKILLPCSLIDKDGIPRYAPAGASYETISMLCPLRSHLVGFATKLGEPAMIFMTSQAKGAERPDDLENDSLLKLADDAREMLYVIDELHDPAAATMHRIEMENIVAHIRTDIQDFPAPSDEFDEKKIVSRFITEEMTKQNVAALEVILKTYSDAVRVAEATHRKINETVLTIKTSWKEIQNRKSAEALKNEEAVSALISAGMRSVEKGVVNTGLPMGRDLVEVIRATNELQEIAGMNTLTSNNVDEKPEPEEKIPAQPVTVVMDSDLANTGTAPRQIQSAEPFNVADTESVISDGEIKPDEPDGMMIDSDAEIITSVTAPQALLSSVPVFQSAPVTDIEASTQISEIKPDNEDRDVSISLSSENAAESAMSFVHPLQNLIDKAESTVTDVVVAVSRLESIKREAKEDVRSIQEIITQVRQSRVQRNREIINWPQARDLIAESRSGLSQGYNQWKWYYSNSPALMVNYIVDLVLETKRWDDLVFKSTPEKTVPIYRIPFKQEKFKASKNIYYLTGGRLKQSPQRHYQRM